VFLFESCGGRRLSSGLAALVKLDVEDWLVQLSDVTAVLNRWLQYLVLKLLLLLDDTFKSVNFIDKTLNVLIRLFLLHHDRRVFFWLWRRLSHRL
jgi:hypothetical protein